jgi:hypothetical protein
MLYLLVCLFVYLLVYVPLKNISLLWRHHRYRWTAAKYITHSKLGLWWALRAFEQVGIFIMPHLLFGLIRRTTPCTCLLRLASGCWGPILTWILTGPHSVASNDMQGGADQDLFLPRFSRDYTLRVWASFTNELTIKAELLVIFCKVCYSVLKNIYLNSLFIFICKWKPLFKLI